MHVASMTVPLKCEMPMAADVVVIGGGIVGVCTAFFCSRLGLETIVVEKQASLGTLTTAQSTECFRMQFESAELIDLVRGSVEMFHNFPDMTGVPDTDINLRPQGYLYATADPQQMEANRRLVETQHRLGLTDVELLSGEDARARFPYVSPLVISARYRAGDGWLSVHELVHGFARGSRARFLLETRAVGIVVGDQGVTAVETDRGVISTQAVVVAAGPFSGRLARTAGVGLPLMLLRRHRLAVLRCDSVPPNAPFTMDDDTGVYWRPEGAGALLGKAFEHAPEEPVESVPVDWTFPAMVLDSESPWSAGRLSPFWHESGNLLCQGALDLSAGQYTYSPDHLPIIGPCPTVPGLYINTGYSGHGIMGAPEGGRRLGLLIAGEVSDLDNPFSLVRFLARGAEPWPKEKIY